VVAFGPSDLAWNYWAMARSAHPPAWNNNKWTRRGTDVGTDAKSFGIVGGKADAWLEIASPPIGPLRINSASSMNVYGIRDPR